MDFSGSAGASSGSDCIPAGQVAYAILTVRGLKGSAKGGQYLDVELTIDEGQPYARKKVWEMIGDPNHPGNSEKYREMGTIAITRILEAGRGAGPNNLAGYKIDNYEQLSGLRVAVKLKVEPGDSGYPDKNKVAEWLTPNPASQSGHKGWVQLQSGVFNTATTKTSGETTSGFSSFGSDSVKQTQDSNGGGASSGFGHGGSASASGFPQPAGDAAQNAGQQSSQTGFAQTTDATAASPSEQAGATPGWLSQAGANA